MSQDLKASLNTPNQQILLGQSVEMLDFILTQKPKESLEQEQKLLTLYNTYRNKYLKSYIQNLEEENAALQTTFKNVDFYILSRIKSRHSYKEKIAKKGEALDIFADKITILSVDGKVNENLLIKTAYDMQKFLITYNPNITEITRKRKDYIKNPKPSGYSSLHITRSVHDKEKDISFFHETQIKTFRMREAEENGIASHSTIYKTNRNSFLGNIESKKSAEYFLPQYMHFEFDKTSRTEKLILDNFENRFKYFFGENYDDFIKLKASVQR